MDINGAKLGPVQRLLQVAKVCRTGEVDRVPFTHRLTLSVVPSNVHHDVARVLACEFQPEFRFSDDVITTILQFRDWTGRLDSAIILVLSSLYLSRRES